MKCFVVHSTQARNRIVAQFKKQGKVPLADHGWIVLAANEPGASIIVRGLELSEVWWTDIGYEVRLHPSKAATPHTETEHWQLLYRQLRAQLRIEPMLWIEP